MHEMKRICTPEIAVATGTGNDKKFATNTPTILLDEYVDYEKMRCHKGQCD